MECLPCSNSWLQARAVLYCYVSHRDQRLQEEFDRIAQDNGVQPSPQSVEVAMGRHLDVPLSAGLFELEP